MGRRLYFRKKTNENQAVYGKSLGKLFTYADSYDGILMSAAYLSDIGALDKFFNDFDVPHTSASPADKFDSICSIGCYFNYGEFFELTSEQFKKFIKLYADDYNKVYNKEIWTDQNVKEIIDIIDSEPKDSIFEFSLGA